MTCVLPNLEIAKVESNLQKHRNANLSRSAPFFVNLPLDGSAHTRKKQFAWALQNHFWQIKTQQLIAGTSAATQLLTESCCCSATFLHSNVTINGGSLNSL